MADPEYVLEGRKGYKVTEDAVAEKAYVEPGNHTFEAHTEGAGSPHVLTADDVGVILTNTGAVALAYHNLPAAVAGAHYHAYVDVAAGMRFVAHGTDTIRNGGTISIAGGYVESVTVGSWLELVCIDAGRWIARPEAPDWAVETSA